MEKETVRQLDRLPGWLSVHEGQFLRKAALLVKDLPGEIVEIGSFQGKSTIWLASSGQTIYAIDPHQGEVDDATFPPTLQAFQKNVAAFQVEHRVRLLRMTSSAAATDWTKRIKLLFIDGLHDEKNALHDFRVWSTFTQDRSVIAMHDAFCGWEGAEKVALRRIVEDDMFYEIGVVGSIIYGIRGRGTWVTRISRWRCRACIRASIGLHRNKRLPSFLSFFLIHRVLKFFLLNRFTLKRE